MAFTLRPVRFHLEEKCVARETADSKGVNSCYW